MTTSATSILTKAIELYNLGHLPVLGRCIIDPTTKKKSGIKFTPGWSTMDTKPEYLASMKEWYEKKGKDYYNIIAIHHNQKLSNIRSIDLDLTNTEDSAHDIEDLVKLAKVNSNPIDQTPSGGYHIFYRSDEPLFSHISTILNKTLNMGIDLLENGRLCIIEGNGYRKVNYTTLLPDDIPSLSAEFIDSINSLICEYKTLPSEDRSSIISTCTTSSISIVEELVKNINIHEEPKILGLGPYDKYPAYIKVLTAIYNSTAYNRSEGLRIAKDFSHRIASHFGKNVDEYINETAKKWNAGWKHDADGRLTIKTLYKLSDYKGNQSMDISVEGYRDYIGDRDLDIWMYTKEFIYKWGKKSINDTSSFYEFIYDVQCAVKHVSSTNSYICKYKDIGLTYGAPVIFNVNIQLTDKYKTYTFQKGYNDIYVAFTDYFKIYDQVIFRPLPSDTLDHHTDMLNTWIGFKAGLLTDELYDPNEVEPFIYHVTDVLCNGNHTYATWVLDWFADLIQHPDKLNGVALILYSYATGTGKSMIFRFLIDCIIGEQHATSCNGLEPLCEAHNTICENKIFVNVEEAFTARNHYALYKNKLKDVITGETISINPKGQKRYTARNYCRFGITTNHIDSIPIDTTNRRFTILEVSDKHHKDGVYFTHLHTKFRSIDFANQVFTYLAKRTITSWLNEPLMTNVGARAIEVTSDNITQFTNQIVRSDYVIQYVTREGLEITLDFNIHKISTAHFSMAFKYHCDQYLLGKASAVTKLRGIEGPNGLMITKHNKKEYVTFKHTVPTGYY